MDQFKKRLEGFRGIIESNMVDAFLVTKRENYIYLSGFDGTLAYLLITQAQMYIFVDFRYVEQANSQAKNCIVISYDSDVFKVINQVLQADRIRTLAFESCNVTYAQYESFLKSINVDNLVPLDDEIRNLRAVKDDYEIGEIQKAVKIADMAFEHILAYIKPGISEIEIAAEIEYNMRKNGAKGASFETIVASGERSSMPHGTATSKKLQQGDVIILDYGALFDDYCSDITRTVFLGQPRQELKDMYELVLKAQLEAIDSVKVGLKCNELDGVARNIIYSKGFDKNFGHGLGHGVGLEIHESPRLSPYCDSVIKANMVATIEPGVYVSGVGGVRIEDVIVIEDTGARILTKAPKEMIII